MPKNQLKKRILLKLSGEALGNEKGEGISPAALQKTASMLAALKKEGCQVAVVMGGGNLWRHRDNIGLSINRVESDRMGMLATVMNALALSSVLGQAGVACTLSSALPIPGFAETVRPALLCGHLEAGHIVLLAGGTGNPYFTTDTAAALRAAELSCDILLKATTVDGVYDKDPKKHPDARRYETLTYRQALQENLAVMDQTAFLLCQENGIPVLVFDMTQKDAILKAVRGDKIGTLLTLDRL